MFGRHTDVFDIADNSAAKRRVRALTVFSWVYFAAILVILLAVRIVSEASWLTTALLYAPKSLFLVPVGLLLLLSVWCRNRVAMFPNLLAAFLILVPLMELNIPWRLWTSPSNKFELKVRVVSYNIARFRFDWNEAVQEIREWRPDLVAFQEMPAQAPAAFRDQFAEWHQVGVGQFWIASRWPLRLVDRCRIVASGRTTGIAVELASPIGPVLIYDFHLISSRQALGQLSLANVLDGQAQGAIARRTYIRRRESRGSSQFVAKRPAPAVILADLNMPSSSNLYRPYWSKFTNAFDHAGWGYGYTAPCDRPESRLTGPWLRPDHILASEHWQVLDCRVGRASGSDHRCITATLGFVSKQ